MAALFVMSPEIFPEFCEIPVDDGLPHIPHELKQEVQVVDRKQAERQRLFRFVEVADISSREMTARVAAAAFFQRREIPLVLFVLDVHATSAHHGHAVPRHPRREYAVEHVDAPRHAFHQAVRRAHAHEVAGFPFRKPLGGVFQNLIHQIMRFPHRKAADGQPVEGHV